MHLLLFIACQASSPQPTEEKTTLTIPKVKPSDQRLREADQVAAADLDGDGQDELIFFHNGAIYWNENREPLEGGLQAFVRSDVDDNGKEELLFATGFSKEFRQAPKSVLQLTDQGITTIWTEEASQSRISDIAVSNGEIFLSVFSEKTNIQGGWLRNGQFKPDTIYNMATKQKPLGESIVISRLYGDIGTEHGDLRIKTGPSEKMLPTLRGVREMILHDLNADGHQDILLADGWHRQYSAMAKARVVLYLGPDFTDVRTLATFDQDYTVNRIEVERLEDSSAQRTPRILVQASQHSYLLELDAVGWKTTEISKIKANGSAVFCYSDTTTSILISGRESINHFLDD